MGALLTIAITASSVVAGGGGSKADEMAILADDFRRQRSPHPQGIESGGVDYHVVTLADGSRVRAVIETYHSFEEYVDAQVAIAERRVPEIDWDSGVQDGAFRVINNAVVGDQDRDRADPFPANPPPINGDPPPTVAARSHFWTAYGIPHFAYPRR